MNAIADTLPSLGVEPRQAAAACVRVPNDDLDKMASVAIASTPLLALLRQLSAAAGLPRAALLADARAVLEAWREKLHDANARARTQTVDAQARGERRVAARRRRRRRRAGREGRPARGSSSANGSRSRSNSA